MVAEPEVISGLDLTGRDPFVRPQDDFYRSWHGHWLDTFEIPVDKADYVAFTALHDEAQEHLKEIIEDVSAGEPPAGSIAAQIAALYASFMDSARRDGLGLEPIAADLARVDGATLSLFGALLGSWDRQGIGGPLGTFVHQDNRDSSRYVLDIRQSGLGLPDRDYYLEAKFADVLSDYRAHIAAMWRMAGFPGDPSDKADRIIEVEFNLAGAQWDRVRNRDPQATYNLVAVEEAVRMAGSLDLEDFLVANAARGKITDVNIGQPDYLELLGGMVDSIPGDDWRDYLRWHLLAGSASLLSGELDAANFAFYGTRLRGIPEQRPMWKRGVDLVQSAVPEALGRLYVERHFPPEHKARMVDLVGHLLSAYGAAIDDLDWMSPATKKQAQAKLATFRPKIGYPDRWRDYSGLRVSADDLVGNVRRAAEFEHDYEMGKLGGPVDRDEWFMPPQMVNAYYNPELNEIVFPAAILQPPFFTMAADDAVNYGGIGAVIGHEISHGFDDKGSQYDGEGNLRDWWTDEDRDAFAAKTAALVAQYGAYEPVAGHPINGELTLGENIADLSGLAVALRAYRLATAGTEPPVIDGLTGEQRFFAGWAQVWRAKTREEEAIRRVATDPHSPPEYRVIGVLVNNDDFIAAHDVQPGDGMWRDPADRVRIW